MRTFGKYQITEKIGEGGFGVIYKGYDPLIKRTVAIKACTSDDQDVRDRFFQEAQIAGNLQHRNITIVYDFGLEGTVPYLVQEYLGGEDLHRKIRRGDEIPFGTRLLYLIQVARGLQHAHRSGVVHRDVKPSNIRVLEDSTVKIMDFGIAKIHALNGALTQTGETIGTAAYLSPEQIRGEPIDPRADIFSFGSLAYELLTGQRAFAGDNPSTVLYRVLNSEPRPIQDLWPLCPDDMVAIVQKCMRKRPVDRYADCGELLADLGRVLDGPTEEASGSFIARPTSDTLRRITLQQPDPLTGATVQFGREVSDVTLGGHRTTPDERSSGLGLLGIAITLTVVAGLLSGGWWYFQGYRASWTSTVPEAVVATSEPAEADVLPPGDVSAETPSARTPNMLERDLGGDAAVESETGTQAASRGDAAPELPPSSASAADTANVAGSTGAARTAPEPARALRTRGQLQAPSPPDFAAEAAPPALLTIRQKVGSPPGWVLANGRELGRTPLQNVSLPPGEYEIAILEAPGASEPSYREPVSLQRGWVQVLTFDLRTQGPLLTTQKPSSPTDS